MPQDNGMKSGTTRESRRPGLNDLVLLLLAGSYLAYLLNSLAVRYVLSEVIRLFNKFLL